MSKPTRSGGSDLRHIGPVLVAGLLACSGAFGLSAEPPTGQTGAEAAREAKSLPANRLCERAGLLATGETALARADAVAALDAFERAALILHAADSEIGVVRSHMQAGDYRRALAFGAHTAGAHLDVARGALMYAWLLQVGGQPGIAQRLLADTEARGPNSPLVKAVRQQLRLGAPRATGQLLAPPMRLAPYGDKRGLPAAAHVAGSAVLLPGGNAAVLPLGLLPRSGKLWLRNGLGQLAAASVEKRLPRIGVALVRLERPLPVSKEFQVAAREAFPGSAGFTVEYVSAPDAEPAWPVLRTGFLGSTSGDSGERLLGIDMPAGPRGGPVFDGAGQLIGLALPGVPGKGGDRLVAVSQLIKVLGSAVVAGQATALDSSAPAGAKPREAVDKIYENSLKTTLQVVTVR